MDHFCVVELITYNGSLAVDAQVDRLKTDKFLQSVTLISKS